MQLVKQIVFDKSRAAKTLSQLKHCVEYARHEALDSDYGHCRGLRLKWQEKSVLGFTFCQISKQCQFFALVSIRSLWVQIEVLVLGPCHIVFSKCIKKEVDYFTSGFCMLLFQGTMVNQYGSGSEKAKEYELQ